MDSIGELEEQDIQNLKDLIDEESWHNNSEFICNKLKQGHRCFLFKDSDKVIGYLWVKIGPGCVTYNGYSFPLLDNDAYLTDGMVSINYRGRSIRINLLRYIFNKYKELGIDNYYSVSQYDNYASIRSNIKSGSEIVKKVTYLQLLGKYIFYTR